MKTEKIMIPQNILNVLEKNINKLESENPKPKGYNEVVRILGLKYITHNQANKLKSFFDNYSPSDSEQREKFEVLGGNSFRNFVNREVAHLKIIDKTSTFIKRMIPNPSKGKQTGRTVDRLNNPISGSQASVTPSKVTGGNIYQKTLTEEMLRLRALITNRFKK